MRIFLGAAYYGAGKMVHPQWMEPAPRKNPKAALGLDYEDVSFQTEGGATLRGWFVPASQSDVGVVAVHGAGANRSEFLTEAKTYEPDDLCLYLCNENSRSAI